MYKVKGPDVNLTPEEKKQREIEAMKKYGEEYDVKLAAAEAAKQEAKTPDEMQEAA